jgi:hypothetical protein
MLNVTVLLPEPPLRLPTTVIILRLQVANYSLGFTRCVFVRSVMLNLFY